jgi:hypothetical protein
MDASRMLERRLSRPRRLARDLGPPLVLTALHAPGVVLGAMLTTACGGGAPLLHPAHVLAQGTVTAGAGVTGQFAFGEATRSLGRPSQVGPNGSDEQAYLERTVAKAAISPGVAPWVGMRVGLGGRNEGGLTYTGRTARADARHAFGDESYALSVGLGVSAVLARVEDREPDLMAQPARYGRFGSTSDGLAARGLGVDIPVIVGYRSTASVAQVWGGVRGGFERFAASLPLDVSTAPQSLTDARSADLTTTHWYGGGLVGAAVGFRPFWVALELDVSYQFATAHADFGSGGQPSVDFSGVTLAPSGAILGKF